MIRLDLRLKVVHLYAVVVHIHADALGLEHLKYLHGVHKRRRLHQNHVTRVNVHLADQIDALQAAGHYHHIVGGARYALGRQQLVDNDLLHILGAADRAVLQRLHAPLILENDLVRQMTEDVDRQRLLGRSAAAE